MGISCAPDIAQDAMEKVLHELIEEIEVYIDDVAVFSQTWEEHLLVLEKVLDKLQQAGFTINPLKCEW